MPRITQTGERTWFSNQFDVGGSITEEKDLKSLLEWVKEPIGPMPIGARSMVEDDPEILNQCRNIGPTIGLCIVTDDRRLCRDVHLQTKNWVCQVPTRIMWALYGMEDAATGSAEPWVDKLSTMYPMYKWETILDTGSIEAFEEAGMDSTTEGPRIRKFILLKPSHTGWIRRREPAINTGRVLTKETLLQGFPDAYLFRPNFLNVRRKHPYGRGWA